METTAKQQGKALEIKLKGRLDAAWAGHLGRQLEDHIRQGSYEMRLDLAEVDYISSAGLRVLLSAYKQLKAIDGSLQLQRPAPAVQKILASAGFGPLMEAAGAPPRREEAFQPAQTETADFEIYELGAGGLELELFGEPGAGSHAAVPVEFAANTFGLGVGSFAGGEADSASPPGEFMAAAGAAACLPAGGGRVPDYMLAAGDYVPALNAIYALRCRGGFSKLVRFAAKAKASLALSEIITTLHGFHPAQGLGVVIIAETTGLVGAGRRGVPPESKEAAFSHPCIQEWLSFTAEGAHQRALALIAGAAVREDDLRDRDTARFFRPLAAGWLGHFHATVFPFQPPKKGRLEAAPTVHALFEDGALLDLLHLLTDSRAISGSGESAFVRGAGWMAPIGNISRGGAK